jgi:hypothetical protein
MEGKNYTANIISNNIRSFIQLFEIVDAESIVTSLTAYKIAIRVPGIQHPCKRTHQPIKTADERTPYDIIASISLKWILSRRRPATGKNGCRTPGGDITLPPIINKVP